MYKQIFTYKIAYSGFTVMETKFLQISFKKWLKKHTFVSRNGSTEFNIFF